MGNPKDEFKEKIIDVVRSVFPGVTGSVRLERTTKRYNGYLVSSDFEGLSFLERHTRVFDALRRELGPDAELISMLFTYTPQEDRALSDAA